MAWWFHFRQICAIAGEMSLLLIGKRDQEDRNASLPRR
jgi:hypothetical protein